MAVDTRDKRFSILGLSQPVPSLYANPDGAISTSDRAQLLFLYAGIALGGAAGLSILDFGRGVSRALMRGMGRGVG